MNIDAMNIAEKNLLVLNSGSSSIKFALFTEGASLHLKLKGQIERIGTSDAVLTTQAFERESHAIQSVAALDFASAFNVLINWIDKKQIADTLIAVGHRIVHGGANLHEPRRLTPAIVTELKQLTPLARQHMPNEVALVEAFQQRFPQLPHIACFDTAFHHNLPRIAQLLAIPRKYAEKGVRRYGFHGLSYEFLMSELIKLDAAAANRERIILAHLGNGASLAAIANGKPIDTSMGFTPTAGVVMGTRSGDLDPGLFSYLARSEQMDAQQFDDMVNFKSGLLGISETSADMRDLLAIEAKDPRAADAVALFCYQVKKTVGAYAAALGGLDTLVFSGGIGEQAPLVRARICSDLGFLGIELDAARNTQNANRISTDASRVTVHVIATDEALVIARSVCRVLNISATSL